MLTLLCLGIWSIIPSEYSYADQIITDVYSVTASSHNGVYSPLRAVNNSPEPGQSAASSRWYCTNSGDKWLQFDLNKSYYISRWYVEHLGAAGWDATCNTRDFQLQSSMDGVNWTTRDTIVNNAANVTNKTVKAFTARYIRIYITQGNQHNNLWASIMDFHIYAADPVVLSVTLPADKIYTEGENLDFNVEFTTDVIVNTNGGIPFLPIATDSDLVEAQYVSGTGTKTLTFRYTVQSGNVDANGIIAGSNIITNGGTIKDSIGNDAKLTLNNVGSLRPAYNVSIATLTGGNISADPTTAEAEATINLTITPDCGNRLKAGSLKYNDGSDHDIIGTSFIMPAADVTVSAEFEAIPAAAYTVIFDANGGSVSTATIQTGVDGKLESLPASARSNYSFNGWFTEVNGGTKITIDHVFIANTTVYAQWTYTGGSSSGSRSSAPAAGSGNSDTFRASIGADGKATATLTQSQINNAFTKAHETGNNPTVQINISGTEGANAVVTTIPGASLQAMASGDVSALTLSSSVATLTFDAGVLSTISEGSPGDATFTASRVDPSALPDTMFQLVGNRPVYQFSVTSAGENISRFGGTINVSLPYSPAPGEDTNAIIVNYINADGNLEIVTNGRYDAASGTVAFTTSHFSKYVVGYNKIYFKDVSDNAWYANAVNFMAARQITTGTGGNSFSPDAVLNRGQFITLLMRAYGITPDNYPNDNFADAGNTYYSGYLATAKRIGISKGIGDNKFAPEQAITRQDLFTLLYNALSSIKQLPEDDAGKTLADFTDSDSITAYAREAMAYLIKTGTVSGSGGKLAPAETTTRAQMTQVLYNLLSK